MELAAQPLTLPFCGQRRWPFFWFKLRASRTSICPLCTPGAQARWKYLSLEIASSTTGGKKIAAARTDRNQSIPGSGFIIFYTEIGAPAKWIVSACGTNVRGILETGKIQSCPKAWSLIQRFEKLVVLAGKCGVSCDRWQVLDGDLLSGHDFAAR